MPRGERALRWRTCRKVDFLAPVLVTVLLDGEEDDEEGGGLCRLGDGSPASPSGWDEARSSSKGGGAFPAGTGALSLFNVRGGDREGEGDRAMLDGREVKVGAR